MYGTYINLEERILAFQQFARHTTIYTVRAQLLPAVSIIHSCYKIAHFSLMIGGIPLKCAVTKQERLIIARVRYLHIHI